MLALPDILHEEKFKDAWEWDGWKPKAKPDAPDEVKVAIAKWLKEADAEDDDDDSFILM